MHTAFPSKPVRIVVPFGAGGVADLTARAVAQKLSEHWGQAVLIDNRPGAGGFVAAELVVNAEPDGHTLFLLSNGTAVSVGLFKHLPFNPRTDFAPISMLGLFDIALAAPSKTPPAVVQRLNADVVKVLAAPDLVQRLAGFNVQAQSSTPAQLAQWLEADIARWRDVIQTAGIAQQ